MDIHSNLEYLCRVCAANTKGKNSVAECVYILKTAGLKDKLDKFLYLKISDNDSLPKVLCKSCFRQVEATAALSKIAKHTQQVFREFLLSNLPKGPSDGTNTSSTDYTTSDYSSKKDGNDKSKKDEISMPSVSVNSLAQLLPQQIPASVTAMLPPPPVGQNLNTTPRKDEVIVNVSVSDPLTRDNQQKMISNSQRRQSLLLESRYTPKSIAQKSSTIASASAVSNQKVVAPKFNATIETANTTNVGKSGTTPTLNFYPINKNQQSTNKQQLQNTQITTFSSGGYVIGNINNDKDVTKKITLPLAPTADNVLQQKRKNLVKALNNIKANNSGQVSLLKSSQQKQTNASSSLTKAPLSEVVNQSAEDELPDKIIIAAPKNKSMTGDKNKKEPLNLSSKIPAVVTAITNTTHLPNTPATITPIVQQHLMPEQSTAATAAAANFNSTPPKSAFPEDILLGRVIRDMDLLKLILKALKWPVNKQNMEIQLQRLKNSKFTDIMSDSNLLQDTDLTQLLGPYLAPVLLAAQALQQQQQQLLNNTALTQTVTPAAAYLPPIPPPTPPKISALEAAQAEINKSIPYKLPPETSVQLVPATPEEQEEDEVQSPPLPNITTTSTNSLLKRDRQKEIATAASAEVPQKRQRRAAAQRARDSIVISDEEDNDDQVPKYRSRQRSNKNSGNIQIELNSNFMSQFNLLTGANSDEANAALLALLQRQKEALLKDKKVQRRRRNSVSNLITIPTSEFDALIDLDDDIVLMEPVTTTSSADSVSATSNNQEVEQTQQQNPFVIPSAPLITRPIIKRRKTVIHSSRARLDTSLDKEAIPISSTAIAANKEKHMEETINQVAKGNLISDTTNNEVVLVATTQQSPTKVSNTNESSQLANTEVSVTKVTAPQKKTQHKAALGQQLLEAIGLQKISGKITNTQTETATSSSLNNNLSSMPNSKQSIQQIRSALKKSLKQAQEQQQLRKKELSSTSSNNTIIQDADSTTKPAVKEIVVVEGKGNKTDDNSSSMVDVEEQIDKVTLMVRKNDDKKVSEQPTTSEKEEKKEKKSPTTKIQERRRTMPLMGVRGARNNAANNDTKETSNNEEEKEKKKLETEKNEKVEENKEKPEKEEHENANISSSSVATASETSVATKEEVVTPKRRGRKRLVDKQPEAETNETNESEKEKETDNKEKDNKSSPAITERSRTFDKTKEEETDNNKNEEEQDTATSNKTSGRPTRQSKQQSKYYKGPEKPAIGRRSLPSRTTRNRKYS